VDQTSVVALLINSNQSTLKLIACLESFLRIYPAHTRHAFISA